MSHLSTYFVVTIFISSSFVAHFEPRFSKVRSSRGRPLQEQFALFDEDVNSEDLPKELTNTYLSTVEFIKSLNYLMGVAPTWLTSGQSLTKEFAKNANSQMGDILSSLDSTIFSTLMDASEKINKARFDTQHGVEEMLEQ